jgi:hypothetical protein
MMTPLEEGRLMRLLFVLSVLALAACGEAPPKPLTAEQSAALRPADPRLAQLYDGFLQGLPHGKGFAGPSDRRPHPVGRALGAGGRGAACRRAPGQAGGMPAGGQCFTCTPDDYRALIRFMAGEGNK